MTTEPPHSDADPKPAPPKLNYLTPEPESETWSDLARAAAIVFLVGFLLLAGACGFFGLFSGIVGSVFSFAT